MTTFETIILIILYLFAFQYVILAMGIKDTDDWAIRLIILISGAMGVFIFPAIFAIDVWNKLTEKNNNESKNYN